MSKTTNQGVTSYHYSGDSRLLSKTEPSGGITSYDYDTAGNMIKETRPDNTIHYTYSTNNQLVEYKDNNQTVTYTYDGIGNRVAKTVNGTTTKYINNINRSLPQVALETTDTNVVNKRYSFGLGRTGFYDWQANSGDKNCYYLYNYPGRSVAALDGNYGFTRDRYQYASFGKQEKTPKTSNTNTFQYTREQYEPETGLMFLRARYYNPEIGRFISKDPFAGWMHNPQSKNMYAYVHNNPLKFVDPSGLAVGDWWDVPANLGHAESLGYEVSGMYFRLAKTEGTRPHNNFYDAMRHAEWSKRVTEDINGFYSWSIGTAHEIRNLYNAAKKGELWPVLSESIMDINNNRVGRNSAGSFIDMSTLATRPDRSTNAYNYSSCR